ncbi:MAG: hypothetical protein P8Y98_10690 [Anaerolineales bacterium]
MNKIPLRRRTGFILFLCLCLIGLPYYFLLRAADVQAAPPALLRFVGLWGGLCISLTFCFFTFSLTFSAQDPRQWIATILSLALFGGSTGLFLLAIVGEASSTTITAATHLGFALVVLFSTVAAGAQFVLPVRANAERSASVRRLFGFLLGERGPVTFLRNGEVIEAHDERSRSGPGVLLIDYASAAVLRTDVKFTRSVGPGLVFTDPGERIEEAADLRRQIRAVEGFIPPSGDAAALESVNSLAVTKDGIPVSTDISVEFMLDPGEHVEPHEGRFARRPPYPWKSSAVEKAVYGHVYGEAEDLPWTELPLRLTIDLWREIIKGKSLKELTSFDSKSAQPLQTVRDDILRRLTTPKNDTQTDDNDDNSSQRDWKILQSRGIRVLDVDLSHLYLPRDIQQERMEAWRHEWASDVQNVLADAQEQATRAIEQGQMEASEILFDALSGVLYEQIRKNPTLSRQDTMRCILKDAVDLCSRDEMVEESPALKAELLDIARELSILDKDCREPGGES